ncbi:AAA family ATPase [Pseudomonas delhiensis]|uniref:AAA family ATPase n=1 Tax=Pseudomonas delhiensis TaxID=366289 RepID=UPI003159C59D
MSFASTEVAEQQWDDFLKHWPLDSLPELTLEQYTRAGDTSTLTYWLEVVTENLGSMWGGSAFKFGIYSRKDKSPKTGDQYTQYSTEYAWVSKYGDSAESAFARVKGLIIDIAQAARRGDLDAIDAADLGTVTKWKLAFLYQNRAVPSVLPVYQEDSLRLASGMAKPATPGQMHAALLAERADQPLMDYGQQVWRRASELAAQRWSGQRLKELLEASDDVTSVKPATARMAGFQAHDGRQLALEPGRKPALFLEPGDWMVAAKSFLPAWESYSVDRTRHSGLQANAPRLWLGHPAVLVSLPSEESFQSLLGLYLDSESSVQVTKPQTGLDTMSSSPLNQILFGPPGTGKTYVTVEAALEVLDRAYLVANRQDRVLLKARFDQLADEGRIRFVTFHQSFSYEDFVEGIRAESDEANGQLRYEVVDGVFKSLCEVAAAKVMQQAEAPIDLGKCRVWKMSLGNTLGSDAGIYDECLQGGYVLLGYGGGVDFSGCKSKNEVKQRFADAGVSLDGSNDYSLTSVSAFVTKMKPGDLVVVSDGNFKFRAIGEISGDYTFKPHAEYEDGYAQVRPVKWLRQYSPSLPHGELLNAQFSQMTLYELRSPTLNREKLQALLGSQGSGSAVGTFSVGQVFGRDYQVVQATPDLLELKKPNGNSLPLSISMLRELAEAVRAGKITLQDIREKTAVEKLPGSTLEPYLVNGYNNILSPLVEHLLTASGATGGAESGSDARVLIIDEINRGNVSRIFGELITLIERSKRAGAEEALSVVLPYSKQRFSVPQNVYLIGTMNTADRSLAGLDIALRRRFEFREMPPRPELLDDVVVGDLNVGQLLRVMNQRIEVLLGREHCLGHAYFMPLVEDRSLERLEAIFRNQILPLLQEYFFEDWQRIQWVFNDHRKPAVDRFVERDQQDVAALFGNISAPAQGALWRINNAAFKRLSAYSGVIAVNAKATVPAVALEEAGV